MNNRFARWVESFFLKYERELTIAVPILMLIWAFLWCLYNGWGDIDNYYNNISSVIDSHQMPYSDATFEYPPFMLVFFLIPKIFSYDRGSFHISFLIFTTIFLFINCKLILKISERLSSVEHRTMFVLVSWIFFSNVFIFCRADIFVSGMVLFGILLYMDNKPILSSIVLALATMTKLYPVLIFGVLMAMVLCKRDWRRLFQSGLVFVAVCVLMELPFLINDASTAFAYLTYHSDRGLQIQSVIASAFLVYNIFVPGSVTVTDTYFSNSISNPVADVIASYMNLITIAVIIIFCLLMVYKMRHIRYDDRERLSLILLPIIVMIFITFSKVYSAQYFIWVATLMPLVLTPIINDEETEDILMTYVVWGLFQFIDETYIYGPLCELNPFAVLVEAGKNLLLIVLMFKLAIVFHRHSRINPDQ